LLEKTEEGCHKYMQPLFGPGSLLEQRYRILKKVGEGGYGMVYQALDEQQWRTVAIKQISVGGLSASAQSDATDAYLRETMLLPGLKHRSLPRVHHYFSDHTYRYVVMDYIEGQTLEELLQTQPEGRLSVSQTREIGRQLCDVLAYLHRQQPPIIFRDVKPANIMLTAAGDLYLIDFGTARRYWGRRKDTVPLGSPGYAAPEQYGKAESTPLTDIYGLGATLQTLLTGKDPLDILTDSWPPDVAVPRDLQNLLEQMMERDPARRPDDMQMVSRVLGGQGRPVSRKTAGQKLVALRAQETMWQRWQQAQVAFQQEDARKRLPSRLQRILETLGLTLVFVLLIAIFPPLRALMVMIFEWIRFFSALSLLLFSLWLIVFVTVGLLTGFKWGVQRALQWRRQPVALAAQRVSAPLQQMQRR
jgi:serine/threonine protein kinase